MKVGNFYKSQIYSHGKRQDVFSFDVDNKFNYVFVEQGFNKKKIDLDGIKLVYANKKEYEPRREIEEINFRLVFAKRIIQFIFEGEFVEEYQELKED